MITTQVMYDLAYILRPRVKILSYNVFGSDFVLTNCIGRGMKWPILVMSVKKNPTFCTMIFVTFSFRINFIQFIILS